MKKLIINADDFGYREGINKGIIYAHKNGLVTSTSLFVNRDATKEAIQLAKENPSLGVGIHLDLDKYFEIDHHLGAVVRWLDPRPPSEELEREIRAQLDLFNSFGLVLDHIDSHHHTHLDPAIFPIIAKIAGERNVPVRFHSRFYSDQSVYAQMNERVKSNGLHVLDHFIEGWYWGNVDEQYQVAELMTHPGYGELWREAELAHCCQKHLRDYFIGQNIELMRFADLVK